MENVMIDIETMGRNGGCVVMSIAAVQFFFGDSAKSLETPDHLALPMCVSEQVQFYRNLNVTEQLLEGFTVESETQKWWMKQSPAARNPLLNDSPDRVKDVLLALKDFLRAIGPKEEVRVWAQGTDFDISILRYMYHRYGGPDSEPWTHTNIFDARTYIYTYGALLGFDDPYAAIPPFRTVSTHSALFDATRSAYNVAYLGNLLHEKIKILE